MDNRTRYREDPNRYIAECIADVCKKNAVNPLIKDADALADEVLKGIPLYDYPKDFAKKLKNFLGTRGHSARIRTNMGIKFGDSTNNLVQAEAGISCTTDNEVRYDTNLTENRIRRADRITRITAESSGSAAEQMQKNLELRIDYQRYEGEQDEEHLQTFHIQPYALKVFNRRWYLLGYIKEKHDLRTIALDRILDLKILSTSFELPEDFDARKYFANVVGIFVNNDLPVTKVMIRAYGTQAEYLRSTPLHKSQTEGRSKYREFAEFTYRLCITPELVSQLLAMGDKVEVLEPQELRDEMKKRISNMSNFYK